MNLNMSLEEREINAQYAEEIRKAEQLREATVMPVYTWYTNINTESKKAMYEGFKRLEDAHDTRVRHVRAAYTAVAKAADAVLDQLKEEALARKAGKMRDLKAAEREKCEHFWVIEERREGGMHYACRKCHTIRPEGEKP